MKGSHCTHPAGTCPATHLHLCSALAQWLKSPRGAAPAGPCPHRAGQQHSPLEQSVHWKSGNHCPGTGCTNRHPRAEAKNCPSMCQHNPQNCVQSKIQVCTSQGKGSCKNKDQNKRHKSVTNCMNVTRLLKEEVSTTRNLCPDQKGRG